MEYFTEMIKSAAVSNSIPMVPTPRKLKLKSVIMKYETIQRDGGESEREGRYGDEMEWRGKDEERRGRGDKRTRREEERRLIQM